jgi:hypothetical protein
MKISIEMIKKYPKRKGYVDEYKGRINIGDFSESIYPALDLWNKEDYEKQWKEGLERLTIYSTSCLIATIHDPKVYKYVNWWVLYREDNIVYVQNEILRNEWYDNLIGDNPFTLQTCYSFVRPRITKTEDGSKISEWSVPYEEK